jgi:hypothetical protein
MPRPARGRRHFERHGTAATLILRAATTPGRAPPQLCGVSFPEDICAPHRITAYSDTLPHQAGHTATLGNIRR